MRFILSLLLVLSTPTIARDLDGKYAQSPLKEWFNQLSSGRGICCSVSDGITIKDVDWDTKDGHYRVFLDGAWIDVPDNAVVQAPNIYGPAVVWPMYESGHTAIRCFMPSSMS